VDIGHVILGALVIVIAVAKLRTHHARKFGLTIVIEREGEDEAESTRDAKEPPDLNDGSGPGVG
jgi:hypothetical protein